MTTSIKSVTTTEAKDRIEELFGDINSHDIAIVNLAGMQDNAEVTTSIKIANIAEIRSAIEEKLNRPMTAEDISIISAEETSDFVISSGTVQQLTDKLKENGFTFNNQDVAIVTSESLDKEKINTVSVGKKLKK